MTSVASREEFQEPLSGATPVGEALAAANSAAGAFWSWKSIGEADRLDLIDAMADALSNARGHLTEASANEIGIAPSWSEFNIDIACNMILQAKKLIPAMRDQEFEKKDGVRSIIKREPVGVVLGFAPWNAPVILAVRAMVAPLACGNSVVLKASEHCPQTHRLVAEVLAGAGLPKGVVNVVTNRAEDSDAVTRALIAHPAIRRINFTGSTRVGRSIAAYAAEHLKRCLLELSGKAPLLVLEDADLDQAADAAALGAFFNQGQVCMSTERIIVVDSIADAFIAKLLDRTRNLRAADPRIETTSLGTLLNADAAQRVRGLIDDAVSRGAHLLIGGETDGAVMQPAIVDRVSANMRLYHEESFGPVASVLRVADEEDAISVANDTEFGLSASVYTRDQERGMRVADRIESGICHINGPTVSDDPDMPFGGLKSSGYGRFGGLAALDEFTELRWIAKHDGPVHSHFDKSN